jgi:proton-dependent oligopeptide transporter, POT family
MTDGAAQPRNEADWFGQPRGLTVLFLTEMWEVFSFVAIRTLLIYYMTQALQVPQPRASLIYGVFTGLVYLTPIVGGYVADRWLGRRRAVFVGGGAMALGHFSLMAPALFWPGLILLALGNGLFLPSLPSQIAGLYRETDPRRGAAYNVYYVGKNLGALIAPLVCGTLGEVFGWRWGFGAAGVGMCIGLAVYATGRRSLPPDTPRRVHVAPPRTPGASAGLARRLILLATVGFAVVLFRAAYEQTGNTLALWIDHGVDRRVTAAFTLRMTWFQALNPALVFILTPFLIAHWTRLARLGRDPGPIVRMAKGAALLAGAWLLLSLAAGLVGAGGAVHWTWLAGYFLLMTLGELYILPTGLGLFSRLAPSSLAATTIAAWYLTSFGGNLLAGALGVFWSRFRPADFFLLLAGVAGAAAVLLWLADRPSRALVGLAPRGAAA